MTLEDVTRGAARLRGTLQDPQRVTVTDIHELVEIHERKARHAAYAAMHAPDSSQWGYHTAASVWCDSVLRRVHASGPGELRAAAGRILGLPDRRSFPDDAGRLAATRWANAVQQY